MNFVEVAADKSLEWEGFETTCCGKLYGREWDDWASIEISFSFGIGKWIKSHKR